MRNTRKLECGLVVTWTGVEAWFPETGHLTRRRIQKEKQFKQKCMISGFYGKVQRVWKIGEQ